MSLSIAWEPLAGLLDDGLADLVRAHWEEVGVHKDKMPLDVNWKKYQDQEDARVLRILAARLDDKLIGYSSFIVVGGHLHYWSTPHAHGDAIYVDKALRHTGAGIALIDRAETDLKAEFAPGYVRILYHDKAFLEFLGPVLRKRGYTHQENIWDKMAGGA
ncbi:MAG TPA: GNAT family N-acetyltransferase [Bradyrhizobium sp.]